MEELFKAVRSSCPKGLWSRAVELVRCYAVTGESAEDDEVVCRVKVADRVVPHTVQLYPEDEEWTCDCSSRAPCCEHVAAAVIAVRKARADGDVLPRGRSHGAKLLYRFSRYRGELSLERVLVKQDGSERVLQTTLASAIATKSAGVDLNPSQEDLQVDRVLAQRVSGPLPPELAVSIVKLLAAARNVELDGEPVQIGTEVLKPVGTVDDHQEGFRVCVDRDPRISEVVASGIALCGDTLHLLDGTRAAGMKLERLPDEKLYSRSDAFTLVTEVLPEMSKRFELSVRARRLPSIDREAKPRALVEVEQAGGQLSAMLTIVYGDPPCARVDRDRLVHLGGNIPVRDETLERRVIARAKEQLTLSPGNRVFLEGDAATALASALDAFDGVVTGSQGTRFIRHDGVAAQMVERDGSVALSFRGSDDGGAFEASPQAVMHAFESGQSLVPLLGGGWAPLPEQWLSQHASLVQQILTAREANALGEDPPPRHALPALAQLCRALDYPAPAELAPFVALLEGLDRLPEAQLPPDLRAELRSYQRDGVNWLSFMREGQMGAVLADDMGLGKTLQTLCVLQGRCLVVCPTSVVHNWADELRKFRPDTRFSVYHGKNRQLDVCADVTLTSYALLRLDQEVLQQVEWDVVVLDEAQSIKNPESQVAQAAYALHARFRMALTGTPVENRLDELWSQFHFTNPGLLGGRTDFQQKFAEPIALGRAGAALGLRQRIAPFLLRRDKRTVAPELPPRTDYVLHCELSDEEQRLYQALHAATRQSVVAKLRAGGNVMQALEALLRLRQAACHPALIPGQHAESSAKVERLVEALKEAVADEHRSLVFSQWTSLLDLLEPHLQRAGIRFTRLDGSTRDRAGVVNEFQSTSGPEVLLLSLKAGGTGLNLTAADHVFLLDPWWNPAVEEQAADRAHRIGQERPVFVHRLVARGTVEERILELQQQKRDIAAVALQDASRATQLSRDDLLELLA